MGLIALLVVSVLFIVLATVKLKLHPFLALLLAAFGFGIAARMPLAEVVKSVNDGFGGTIGNIGIVILAGCIIGTFLEKSGGAYRVAEGALRLTGRKNVPMAMAIVGYIVSIPVFCDSGFVLLSPLNKALARKAKVSLAMCAVALSAGLYATHTMVPPTPGPVAAAGILEADVGLVILWGLLVSVVAAFAGWLFAVNVAGKVTLASQDDAVEVEPAAGDKDAPSVPKALVPILLPIVLIVLRSIAELPSKPLGEGQAIVLLGFLGQPVVALLLGVCISFLLPKKFDREMLSTTGWVGEAMIGAATIIIITGAGGAFGKVLQNSGIADVIGTALKGREGIGILLPVIIAASLKTAQGSSTVALITTAGLVLPLLPSLGLESETAKALVVVAIGAGSMVVSHANDSYFWVVTQFSGMSVNQGYRLQSLGTLVTGGAAALTVWILSVIVL
ncbi:MAG TPA: GntP family permease [Candidatus Hydrogenedentes bacterium]|nr:GntP family permease [Candidatus Hydrogenedentota bacterium]HPG65643.1 GntP family permease [Candidatus Hydrogenedentota bacterium]